MSKLRSPEALRPKHRVRILGDNTIYSVVRAIHTKDHYLDQHDAERVDIDVTLHMVAVDGGEFFEYHPGKAEVLELVSDG